MVKTWKCIFHIYKTVKLGKFMIVVTDEVTEDIPAEHVSGAC